MEIKLSAMDYWYRRMPGTMLLDAEQSVLDKLLPTLPGNYVLQLGGPSDLCLLKESRARYKAYLGVQRYAWSDQPRIQASIDELPLIPQSIDTMLISHMLEMTQYPDAMIKQCCDALVDGGYLLLFGFNPYSMWNIARMQRKALGYPWNGSFWSLASTLRYLRRNQFRIVTSNRLLFRPPARDKKTADRWLFLEPIGQLCLPACAGVYFVVAQKRAVPLNPVRDSWWQKKVVVNNGNGYAEPTTRSNLSDR